MRRPMEVGLPGSGPPQLSATTTAATQGQPGQGQSPQELLDAMASIQEQYRLGTLSEQDFLAHMNSTLAAMRVFWPRRSALFIPPAVPPSLLASSSHPPSRTDLMGSGPWPIMDMPTGGFYVFLQDTGLSGFSVGPGWAALPKDQKEAYRARAEARRREAWANFESRLARKAAESSAPPLPQPAPAQPAILLPRFPGPVYPSCDPVLPLSGFELFRDELVAGDGGLGFWEVLERWEALTDEQRAPYDIRAWEANKVASR
ncbi:hypothetical protein VTK56DRAFT_3023 [Thermocarpiscus australiensis]